MRNIYFDEELRTPHDLSSENGLRMPFMALVIVN